jgi:hypothetical protein
MGKVNVHSHAIAKKYLRDYISNKIDFDPATDFGPGIENLIVEAMVYFTEYYREYLLQEVFEEMRWHVEKATENTIDNLVDNKLQVYKDMCEDHGIKL